jgi:UDP-glucose 4-epimerase
MNNLQNVLVTGGAGFVGSNVVALLLQKGHEVSIFDNFEMGLRDYLDTKSIRIVQGDLRDEEAINNAVAGHDAVIHLAAYGNVIDSIKDPVTNFEINVRGTLNLLRACVSNSIQKVVFSSTGGALMGNTPPPVNEKSVPKPISPYGASKLACEGYLSAFSEAYGLNTVAFRFANVYGPNSAHKKGVINKYIEALDKGSDLIVYGESVRDFIFVEDLAKGIVAGLSDKLGNGQVFHLSSNIGVAIKDLAQTLSILRGRNADRVIFQPGRKGEVVENFADNRLAQDTFGFKIETELRDGLTQTLDWFDQNERLWK